MTRPAFPLPSRGVALVAAALSIGSASAAAAERRVAPAHPAVEDVAQKFAEAWNRHDMDAFATLFAARADFVNVIGLHWHGRGEIKQAHEQLHATRMKESRLAMSAISARMLRPEVALVHATWELTGDTGLDGKVQPPRRGVLSFVLEKEGGRWLIESAQNTDIVPLPNVPPAR